MQSKYFKNEGFILDAFFTHPSGSLTDLLNLFYWLFLYLSKVVCPQNISIFEEYYQGLVLAVALVISWVVSILLVFGSCLQRFGTMGHCAPVLEKSPAPETNH